MFFRHHHHRHCFSTTFFCSLIRELNILNHLRKYEKRLFVLANRIHCFLSCFRVFFSYSHFVKVNCVVVFEGRENQEQSGRKNEKLCEVTDLKLTSLPCSHWRSPPPLSHCRLKPQSNPIVEPVRFSISYMHTKVDFLLKHLFRFVVRCS